MVRGLSGAMVSTACCDVLAVHRSRDLVDSRECRVLSLSSGSGGCPLTRSLLVRGRCEVDLRREPEASEGLVESAPR